jgi:hypothetical protein
VKKLLEGQKRAMKEEFMKLMGRFTHEICRKEGAGWWKVDYM